MAPFQSVMPNLEPSVWYLPDGIKLNICQKLQDKQDRDIHNIQAWSSKVEDHFKSMYEMSADLINGAAENLRLYSKLLWVLDYC